MLNARLNGTGRQRSIVLRLEGMVLDYSGYELIATNKLGRQVGRIPQIPAASE